MTLLQHHLRFSSSVPFNSSQAIDWSGRTPRNFNFLFVTLFLLLQPVYCVCKEYMCWVWWQYESSVSLHQVMCTLQNSKQIIRILSLFNGMWDTRSSIPLTQWTFGLKVQVSWSAYMYIYGANVKNTMGNIRFNISATIKSFIVQ